MRGFRPASHTDHVRELLGAKADPTYYSDRAGHRSGMACSLGWAADRRDADARPESEEDRRVQRMKITVQRLNAADQASK